MIAPVVILPEMFSRGHLMPVGDSPDDARLSELLAGLRWVADNGVLIDLDSGEWLPAVYYELDSQSDQPHCRDLREALKVLQDRHRLVRLKTTANDDWLVVAMDCHDTLREWDGQGLARILVPEVDSSSCRSQYPIQFDWAAPPMSHQPIWHRVSTKVDETSKILQTIVGYANAITIVDPYLDPDKPASKEFIKVLAHLLTTRPIQFQSTAVEFHVRDPSQSYDGSRCKSVETAKAEWSDCLKPLVGYDPRLSFTVRFWQERSYNAQWEKMHDRWLKTDFATVIAPSGFDVVQFKGWRRSAWGILDASAADWLSRSLNTVGTPEVSSLKPCEPPLTIAAGLSG